MAKAAPHKLVTSLRMLADLVGRKPSSVRKWPKHPRWCFSRFGPWTMDDVRLIKGWAERYLKHDAAADYHALASEAPGAPGLERPLTKMEEARLACLVHRARLLLQRYEIEKGSMHVAKDCESNILRVALDIKSRLLAMPRTLAHTLAGRDAAAIETALDQHVRMLLKGLVLSLSLQGKMDDGRDDTNKTAKPSKPGK